MTKPTKPNLEVPKCEHVPCGRDAEFIAGGGAVADAFACKEHGPDATAAMVADGTIDADDAWLWEPIAAAVQS